MNPNLAMLDEAARVLDGLDVVFVGGATVALHLTEEAQGVVRPTDDIDCAVEVGSRLEHSRLEGELRRRGLRQRIDGKDPICRWHTPDGLVIDVMPTDPAILGFSNHWYTKGARSPVQIGLPTGRAIRTFQTAYLLASKIDAFRSRGRPDPYTSVDLEDIVALVDGVDDIEARVRDAGDAELASHVAAFFQELLAEPEIGDWMEGHLPRPVTPERYHRAVARMARLAGRSA